MIERTARRALERRRALFSPCGLYRYLLEIRMDLAHLEAKPLLPLIGLNPSDATELRDDPTIRRVIRFALDMGFAGVCMLNVAALCSPDPREMLAAADPIGPGNSVEFLAEAARAASAFPPVAPMALACWGTKGAHRALAPQVRAIRAGLGVRLYAFGLTSNRQPLHPLYLPASSRPRPLVELEQEADAAAALRAGDATGLAT